MHHELDELLCAKYPGIFLPGAKRVQAIFGFECGDGWYPLINAACALIQGDIQATGNHLVASQVKQKFGGLRFYYRGGDDYAASVISLAESLATHVCEVCGAFGKGVVLFGWMHTRCLDHEETTTYEDALGASGRQYLQTIPVMDELLGSALVFFACDGQAAARWLIQPVRALGHAIPLALAGTLEGQRQVMDVLGRLEHGIPQ